MNLFCKKCTPFQNIAFVCIILFHLATKTKSLPHGDNDGLTIDDVAKDFKDQKIEDETRRDGEKSYLVVGDQQKSDRKSRDKLGRDRKKNFYATKDTEQNNWVGNDIVGGDGERSRHVKKDSEKTGRKHQGKFSGHDQERSHRLIKHTEKSDRRYQEQSGRKGEKSFYAVEDIPKSGSRNGDKSGVFLKQHVSEMIKLLPNSDSNIQNYTSGSDEEKHDFTNNLPAFDGYNPGNVDRDEEIASILEEHLSSNETDNYNETVNEEFNIKLIENVIRSFKENIKAAFAKESQAIRKIVMLAATHKFTSNKNKPNSFSIKGDIEKTSNRGRTVIFKFNISSIDAINVKKVRLGLHKKYKSTNDTELKISEVLVFDSKKGFESVWYRTFRKKMGQGRVLLQISKPFILFRRQRERARTMYLKIRCTTCSEKRFKSIFVHKGRQRPHLIFDMKEIIQRECDPQFECCKKDLALDLNELGKDVLSHRKTKIDYCHGTCDFQYEFDTYNGYVVQMLRLEAESDIERKNYRMCCVPVAFQPITVMMRPDNRTQYRETIVHDLKVAKCGCR